MIVLRSVFACDRRTLEIISLTNNLRDVPGWLAGNSIVLSEWNMDIMYDTDQVDTLTNLSYPIEVHWDRANPVDLNKVKIYRDVGNDVLYFELTNSAAYGSKFDFYIEFVEKSEQ